MNVAQTKKQVTSIEKKNSAGADAINISGHLNPKKLGNLKNWML